MMSLKYYFQSERMCTHMNMCTQGKLLEIHLKEFPFLDGQTQSRSA